jgi:Fibronectin type III domain
VTVPFTAAQSSGDLNVVVVGWNDTTAKISAVKDTVGNTYTLAVGPTTVSGSASQAIYYAKNIGAAAAGANSVTVTFSATATYADIRALEYGGVNQTSPVDVTSASTGNSNSSSSAAVTTTNASDLLLAANLVGTTTSGPGSGFTSRMVTTPDGDIAEDRMVTATGSYSASAPLTSSGFWIMQMVAFKAAGTVATTPNPPTAPGGLAATAASTSQINLSWTASTSTVGVANYLVQRCQGAGCSSFSQIATVAAGSTTYSDTGLTASTSYSYRVQAVDTSGAQSAFSSTATATTKASATTAAPVTYVQGNYATPQTSQSSVAVNFTKAQTAGNLNVIVVGWNDSSATVTGITDKSGNAYTLAVGPTVVSGSASQSIYYAKNILGAAAGANTVTVTFSKAASYPDIRILEYSGASPNTPIDVTAAGSGNSSTTSTPAVTTTNPSDLLLAANLVGTATSGPGSGFTSRMVTSPDGDIVQDRNVTATGSYSASAPLTSSGFWIMQLVALRTP